jgi:hypothetical protein
MCGPYPLTCLAWIALPGAYTPISIAVWVTGIRKPLVSDKVVVLKEDVCLLQMKKLVVHIEHMNIQEINNVPKIVDHIWLQQMMNLSKVCREHFIVMSVITCTLLQV